MIRSHGTTRLGACHGFYWGSMHGMKVLVGALLLAVKLSIVHSAGLLSSTLGFERLWTKDAYASLGCDTLTANNLMPCFKIVQDTTLSVAKQSYEGCNMVELDKPQFEMSLTWVETAASELSRYSQAAGELVRKREKDRAEVGIIFEELVGLYAYLSGQIDLASRDSDGHQRQKAVKLRKLSESLVGGERQQGRYEDPRAIKAPEASQEDPLVSTEDEESEESSLSLSESDDEGVTERLFETQEDTVATGQAEQPSSVVDADNIDLDDMVEVPLNDSGSEDNPTMWTPLTNLWRSGLDVFSSLTWSDGADGVRGSEEESDRS